MANQQQYGPLEARERQRASARKAAYDKILSEEHAKISPGFNPNTDNGHGWNETPLNYAIRRATEDRYLRENPLSSNPLDDLHADMKSGVGGFPESAIPAKYQNATPRSSLAQGTLAMASPYTSQSITDPKTWDARIRAMRSPNAVPRNAVIGGNVVSGRTYRGVPGTSDLLYRPDEEPPGPKFQNPVYRPDQEPAGPKIQYLSNDAGSSVQPPGLRKPSVPRPNFFGMQVPSVAELKDYYTRQGLGMAGADTRGASSNIPEAMGRVDQAFERQAPLTHAAYNALLPPSEVDVRGVKIPVAAGMPLGRPVGNPMPAMPRNVPSRLGIQTNIEQPVAPPDVNPSQLTPPIIERPVTPPPQASTLKPPDIFSGGERPVIPAQPASTPTPQYPNAQTRPLPTVGPWRSTLKPDLLAPVALGAVGAGAALLGDHYRKPVFADAYLPSQEDAYAAGQQLAPAVDALRRVPGAIGDWLGRQAQGTPMPTQQSPQADQQIPVSTTKDRQYTPRPQQKHIYGPAGQVAEARQRFPRQMMYDREGNIRPEVANLTPSELDVMRQMYEGGVGGKTGTQAIPVSTGAGPYIPGGISQKTEADANAAIAQGMREANPRLGVPSAHANADIAGYRGVNIEGQQFVAPKVTRYGGSEAGIGAREASRLGFQQTGNQYSYSPLNGGAPSESMQAARQAVMDQQAARRQALEAPRRQSELSQRIAASGGQPVEWRGSNGTSMVTQRPDGTMVVDSRSSDAQGTPFNNARSSVMGQDIAANMTAENRLKFENARRRGIETYNERMGKVRTEGEVRGIARNLERSGMGQDEARAIADHRKRFPGDQEGELAISQQFAAQHAADAERQQQQQILQQYGPKEAAEYAQANAGMTAARLGLEGKKIEAASHERAAEIAARGQVEASGARSMKDIQQEQLEQSHQSAGDQAYAAYLAAHPKDVEGAAAAAGAYKYWKDTQTPRNLAAAKTGRKMDPTVPTSSAAARLMLSSDPAEREAGRKMAAAEAEANEAKSRSQWWGDTEGIATGMARHAPMLTSAMRGIGRFFGGANRGPAGFKPGT